MLVAGAGKLENISNPLHAEALAMKQAVLEASRMGCLNVILETDASILKQVMMSESYDESSLGALFRDIRSMVRLSFQCCKIEHCPRSCNILAHSLAAFGTRMEAGNYHIWLAPFPPDVNDLIAGRCPANIV